jgi:DNA helicase II / ATP-dependent DNA helicase PcrA
VPLDLAQLLNQEQLEAATTTEGPLLILAGAGSGKTRVLVHRIAHIVEQKRAWPRQIFAVTFTNKAAGEMKGRVGQLLKFGVEEAWIGTFHGMCGRMLRWEGKRLGYDPSFSIYDTDDSRRVIKRVMEDLGIETDGRGVSVAQVASEIDRAKNHGWSPKKYAESAGTFRVPAVSATIRVYPRYQEALRKSQAMDFGDLLLLALELLEHHPEARDRIAGRFKYVLVDEFQDTNKVQFDLLKQMLLDHENLAVVGDDDQAIYRWRGADVSNILDFNKTFPNTKVVRLEQNYRSTGHILTAANTVIKRNKRRHHKELRTDAPPGMKIGVALVNHGDEEAFLVAQTIAQRIGKGEKPGDFAILYRMNAQSRSFEEQLRRARVPFTIIGGMAFYERREVKDVISYLRLIANPASMEDLERVINVPPRKIGDTTVQKLRQAGEAANLAGSAILELDAAKLEAVGVKGKTLEKVKEVATLLQRFRKIAETASASEVAKAVIDATKYLEYLEESDPVSAEDRIANVEELVSSIAEHEQSVPVFDEASGEVGVGLAGAKTALADFLDRASLVTTNDVEGTKDTVSLLTLHAAKGLEFPVVYIVGLEEQTFPSRRACEGDEEDMEEERRLCYVGITRAMRELNLLCARFRRIFGQEEVRAPSRFLGELPDHIVTTFGKRQSAPPIKPSRGETWIDRDEGFDPIDDEPYVPPQRKPRPELPPIRDERLRIGSRVIHNSFGVGVVEEIEGSGAKAHLTIRFPTEGTKRVVARFVRALEDS